MVHKHTGGLRAQPFHGFARACSFCNLQRIGIDKMCIRLYSAEKREMGHQYRSGRVETGS